MRNLLTAILFFGGCFFLWNWHGENRGAASVQDSQVMAPEMFVKRAAIGGWEGSTPKSRPFEALKETNKELAGMAPVDAATLFLETNREQYNLQSHHAIRKTMMQSPLGTTVRFEFAQDGVPITGMYINMDLGKDNEIRSVENLYRPMEEADLKAPMLTATEVTESLSQRYIPKSGGDATMMLYAGPQSSKPEPVYSVSATEVANNGTTNRPVTLLIRASDGQVLDISYERPEVVENQLAD